MRFKFLSWVTAQSKALWSNAAIYVLLTLFSGMGLAFIFASGSLVQSLTVAFLVGKVSSVYDGDNVGQLVSAKSYISIALWPPYLAAGLLSAIAMVQASTKRSVLIWGTISIGTSLTMIDMAFADNANDMAVSVVCNFAAGFLLAIFTLVLALNMQVARLFSGGGHGIEKGLWILGPFVGYSILACFIFFALNFLTTIPAISSNFRLEPPLSGYYVTGTAIACNDFTTRNNIQNDEGLKCDALGKGVEKEPNDTQFSVLGKFDRPNGGEIEFVGDGGGTTFEWSKEVARSIEGSLWITQGCIVNDAIKDAMKSKPIFHGSLNSLRITLDKGMSNFHVIDSSAKGIEVSDDKISQFWINNLEKETNKLYVSRFLDKGVIDIPDGLGSSIFAIGLFPLVVEDNKFSTKRRIIKYVVNGTDSKTIDISINSKLVSPKAATVCAPLSWRAVDGGFSASADVPYVSLAISIEQPKLISLDDLNRSGHMIISEANGWIKSSGYRKVDLYEAIKSGSLSQLSVFGAVKTLEVDGQVVPTGETSTLQLSGRLVARSDGAGILLQGNVDYLILNGRRLTATRWERLDGGLRIPIILGVPTAIYFFLNFAIATLRRPARKVWHPPWLGRAVEQKKSVRKNSPSAPQFRRR